MIVDTVGLLMTVIAPGRISRSRLEKIKLLNYESGAELDSYNTARSVTLLPAHCSLLPVSPIY